MPGGISKSSPGIPVPASILLLTLALLVPAACSPDPERVSQAGRSRSGSGVEEGRAAGPGRNAPDESPTSWGKRHIETPWDVPREEAGPGRWVKQRPPRNDPSLTEEQEAMIERLNSIGYLSGSVESSSSGVVVHVRNRVDAGLNFYTSGHGPEAVLMDMEGNELHRWRQDFFDAWPEAGRSGHPGTEFWRRAHLFDNGDVLAIFEGVGIIKMDADSRLLWASSVPAHHDLDILPGGDILVLTRRAHLVPRIHETEPIFEDFITVLDAGGNEKRSISLVEAFVRSDFVQLLHSRKDRSGDIFHTNALSLIERQVAGAPPQFAPGRVLVAMNRLGTYAVVDLESEAVVWAHEDPFRGGVHDPELLPGGRLLLFHNAAGRGSSQLLEFELATGKRTWAHPRTPDNSFFSPSCGTAQRLPNGNTLITESDGGRALEVTRNNEIVWEFFNPHRAGEDGRYIGTLFEVERLPADVAAGWLEERRR